MKSWDRRGSLHPHPERYGCDFLCFPACQCAVCCCLDGRGENCLRVTSLVPLLLMCCQTALVSRSWSLSKVFFFSSPFLLHAVCQCFVGRSQNHVHVQVYLHVLFIYVYVCTCVFVVSFLTLLCLNEQSPEQ